MMRLWRRSALILALGLFGGGCSFSYQLPSLAGTNEKARTDEFAHADAHNAEIDRCLAPGK